MDRGLMEHLEGGDDCILAQSAMSDDPTCEFVVLYYRAVYDGFINFECRQ